MLSLTSDGIGNGKRDETIVGLARDEAGRLGYDHVSTGHVLLGLLAEENGAGLDVHRDLSINPARVRGAVESTFATPPDDLDTRDLPLAPRVKEMLDLSMEEATTMGHAAVGSDHLLLGMVRSTEGVAARVLRRMFAVDLREAREHVARRRA